MHIIQATLQQQILFSQISYLDIRILSIMNIQNFNEKSVVIFQEIS